MPTEPVVTYRILRLDPVIDPDKASAIAVNLAPSTVYPSGTVLGEQIGVDEVVTITIDATGGFFKIHFGAQSTPDLDWDATAAEVQAALEALSSILPGNILVTKAGLVYTLVFRGDLGSTNVGAVTTTDTLTGGAGTATVAVVTAGVPGNPGVYAPYAAGNTDGSQDPKGLLQYAVATDADGRIWLGEVAGSSEWQQSTIDTPMWVKGTFRTEDTVGLDTAAIDALGRLVYGTVAHGAFSML